MLGHGVSVIANVFYNQDNMIKMENILFKKVKFSFFAILPKSLSSMANISNPLYFIVSYRIIKFCKAFLVYSIHAVILHTIRLYNPCKTCF